MSFPGRPPKRANAAITAVPGEIWHFRTTFAPHSKFHLCVSYDRHFLFMNSAKSGVRYPDNYILDHTSVRRLPKTAEGISIVSCGRSITQPIDVVLRPEDARGSLLADEMLAIVEHIERGGYIERRMSNAWLPDLRIWAETMCSN